MPLRPLMKRREILAAGARAALAVGLARSAAGCAAPAPRPAPRPRDAGSSFAALRERYFVRSLALNPVTSTYLGGDAYSPALADANGRLRDYRPAAIAGELAFYREVQRELTRLAPPPGSPEAVDRAVIEAQLAFLLRQLGERRYHERAVDTYVVEPFRGVDWQIQQMSPAGGALYGTEAEWELVVSRVRAVPAYVEAARANLLAGKASGNLPDGRAVERDGVRGSGANAEYFRRGLAETAARLLGDRPFAPKLLARLREAGAAAGDAYASFASFLSRDLAPRGAEDRFALGEREYAFRLRNNLAVARSPAEVYAYGAGEVARGEARIFAAAEQIAREAKLGLRFEGDAGRRAGVRAVMEHLSQDAPSSDAELLRWYVAAGERAVAYGRERGLFDVPADYRLDVLPTPPVLSSGSGAAYYPAPPLKQTGVGRFYLDATGEDPAALRENNRPSVASTAVHEGFPGHDWHYKFMTTHAAEIPSVRWLTPGSVEDSSSMWQDAMATEGWALYAEELMAEPAPGRPHGFYSAAEHLYMLREQLMRAVRVRVDVGLHTGRMRFDEAVDYAAEHVEFMPGARAKAASDPAARAAFQSAERAIYRYSKWPTQAITYNLGMREIIALRDEYRARRGAAYEAREFHERLMRQGAVPAGLARASFFG
jgi:uncharacterized protein (DUF885 family)